MSNTTADEAEVEAEVTFKSLVSHLHYLFSGSFFSILTELSRFCLVNFVISCIFAHMLSRS